jgi:hypothetical protein
MISAPPPNVIYLKNRAADGSEPSVKSRGTKIATRIAKGQPMKHAASMGPDYSVDKEVLSSEAKPKSED